MTAGWNLAEIWERNADRFPDADRAGAGRPLVHLGRVRPARRRHRRHAAAPPARSTRTRWRTTSTTAPSTWRACSACSRPALVPVNTNYRYSDDELAYLWTTPTPWPSSSTARSPSTASTCAPRVPGVHTWIWVDDGSGAVPRRGPSPTRPPRRRATGRTCRRRGAAAPTTSTSSTPAAPPACPRA